MMRWVRPVINRSDRILLAIMLAGFLWMGFRAYQRFSLIDTISAGDSTPGVPPKPYHPNPATPLRIETQTWEAAPPQSGGKEWVYDVFTPPVIYYNPVTLQFTVSPPEFKRPVELTEDSFALELLEVRPQPFRLQLVGYVGCEGDHLVTFECVSTGESLVGRPGKRFDTVGVTLRTFELRKESIPMGGGAAPVFDTVAVAVVYDEETGEDWVLTDKTKAMLPGPEAVFRISGSPIIEYLLKEGAEIVNGRQTYTIDALILSPSQATITLSDPDLPEPVTRTVYPVPRYFDPGKSRSASPRR